MTREIKMIIAFSAIYFIWGSTYLAIAYAIETLPPFLMAGVRNLIAGGILMIWAFRQGPVILTLAHWKSAVIIGGLLFLCGNGGVVWAEQKVPSGIAALIISTIPLWMVVLNWIGHDKLHPGKRVLSGLALGFIGIIMLIDPGNVIDSLDIDLVGTIVIVVAAFCWSAGSLYARRAEMPKNHYASTAIQMLSGGILLLVFSMGVGEWQEFHIASISFKSLMAVLYLIGFGSLIAYSAYNWLLRNTTPAKLATYAYVNPVIAILLGWLLAGEPLSLRILFAALIILSGVILITAQQLLDFKKKKANRRA